MTPYDLKIPKDFLEYEWEVEAKGWFPDVVVCIAQKEYQLEFYDAVRLSQEVADALNLTGVFHVKNLVVVKVVNLKSIENAVKNLVNDKSIFAMVAEQAHQP